MNSASEITQGQSELPHPARADALAEGGASCFHDVVRLRLTAHQTESGERALQEPPWFPQGAQSPQALTNRGVIRSHIRIGPRF
jgi:hypothetical protein